MLEAQALHGIGQLDVHSQVIGVELQDVARMQGCVLLDVQDQAGGLPFDLQTPVPVALRVGLERNLLLLFTHGSGPFLRRIGYGALIAAGIGIAFGTVWWAGLIIALIGVYRFAEGRIPERVRRWVPRGATGLAVLTVALILSSHWLPLGPEKGLPRNFIFVALLIGGLLLFLAYFQRLYGPMLRWCLDHKAAFLSIPVFIVLAGGLIWLGFEAFFGGGGVSQNLANVTVSVESQDDLDLMTDEVRIAAEEIFGADNVVVSAASQTGLGGFSLIVTGNSMEQLTPIVEDVEEEESRFSYS